MKKYVYCQHRPKEAENIRSSVSFVVKHRKVWNECASKSKMECCNCGCHIMPTTFLLIYEFWRGWILGPLVAFGVYLTKDLKPYCVDLSVLAALFLYYIVPILLFRYGKWKAFYVEKLENQVVQWHIRTKQIKWIPYVQDLLICLSIIYWWMLS